MMLRLCLSCPLVRAVLVLALATGLAACSGGTAVRPLELQIFDVARENVARRTAPEPAARPQLTRAALDTVSVSAIEVTLERPDILSYLLLHTERRDDSSGVIRIWRS